MSNFSNVILVLNVLLCLLSCSQRTINDINVDKKLEVLLKDRNYFDLQTTLKNKSDKLSEDRYLFYQAHCSEVFNESKYSQECITKLFTEFQEKLNDTIISDLLEVESRNYVKMFQYKKIVEVSRILLDKYAFFLDSAKRAHYNDNLDLYGKLISLEPTTIKKEENMEIKSSRNPVLNYVTVPVHSGGISKDFIFDTGAEMSCVSTTTAAKMGMTLYDTEINIETPAFAIKAKLAVADTFYIGDVLFKNVIFLVVPIMNVPDCNFFVSGVIGIPEMRLMEEIHISKNGSIFIPQNIQSTPVHNMFYGGLSGVYPYIRVVSGVDTLNMALDFGANTSHLTKKFLYEHKEEIVNHCESKDISVAGLGGERKIKSYYLNNFSYKLKNKKCVLPNIDINNLPTDDDKSDGLIGQDMLIPFQKVKINFKNMYVDVE